MSKTIKERIDAKGVWYDSNDNCCVEYSSVVELINEQRAIDEEELKPQWISVEDMLPSYDKHYVNMLVYSAASFIAYYDGCKWWVCGPEQMEIKPSHWMPLPESPTN